MINYGILVGLDSSHGLSKEEISYFSKLSLKEYFKELEQNPRIKELNRELFKINMKQWGVSQEEIDKIATQYGVPSIKLDEVQ
jgi:hypothetical protein